SWVSYGRIFILLSILISGLYSTVADGKKNQLPVDFSLFDDVDVEKLISKCESIFVWLKDELGELSDNIATSEGYIRVDFTPDGLTKPNDVQAIAAPKRVPSKCDLSIFKDDQSLTTLFERLFSVLDAMRIFAQYDPLKESCVSEWAENLQITYKISKLISDTEKSKIFEQKVKSLCESLNIDAENENCEFKFEKFKSDDELYILRNGLPGYQGALDKILSSIGGHEWNTKVLDVLEQRANMIDNFDQMKLLVDVLHSASVMIDMRIQSSLYSIFKVAFHNQKFSLRKEVMNYYYQKYQLWNSSESDPQYGTELNSIINSLAEHSSKGTLRQLAVRLSWHFMLSAKNCWWRLLNAIISMPKLTQALVDILKHLPVVSSLKIPETGERLLFAGLKRLLEQNCLKNEDNETAWANFCVNLCNGAPKKPVYEPAFIINEFLLPLLPSYPWILLPCFYKLLNDKTAVVHFRYPLIVVKKFIVPKTENDEEKTDEISTSETASSKDVLVVQKEVIAEKNGQNSDIAVAGNNDENSNKTTVEMSVSSAVLETMIDENVELVDPLMLFGKFLEIYVRATRDGHSETAQNLKVRLMCLNLFSTSTNIWRKTAEKESRPFLLDSKRIDELFNEYSALPWAKRFYLRHILRDFRQTPDDSAPKMSALINIPGCLFDKLDLPATIYARDDCCEMDQSDPLTAMKMHPAVCALKSLIESALVSPDLCKELLNGAADFAYFRKLPSDDFRKFLSRAIYEQLNGKGVEDFRAGIACLKEIFDRMEMEKCKNGVSYDDPFVEGLVKGLKYSAPVSFYYMADIGSQ
uniref:Edg1 TPR repeats region domain-containing protein n=1 Tax=Romanomermis culicivorax TaxID=13658 RepID=A0A915KFA4_ROMCU